jgi:protoheme IX farnesyltransferase
VTLLAGALAAGGSAAINCWFDRDIDAEMGTRTKRRAIPAGVVSPSSALWFGVTLSVASIALLSSVVNALSALLTGVAILIYVGIYTLWLKRSTPSNIVLGGAAGAIPPLIGWAAVTGDLTATPWLLFALVFFWTPPHFWALALLIHDQYARAGVPMLPVVRGEAETRRQIVYYSLQMVSVSALLFGLGGSGLTYLIGAGALGGYFIFLAVRLARGQRREDASRLFHYSMVYLVLVCAVLVLDARVDFWAN